MDDTKTKEVVDSLKGREALKKDLDKLQGWAITNHVKYTKRKCQILHLGWDNLSNMYRQGDKRLGFLLFPAEGIWQLRLITG